MTWRRPHKNRRMILIIAYGLNLLQVRIYEHNHLEASKKHWLRLHDYVQDVQAGRKKT